MCTFANIERVLDNGSVAAFLGALAAFLLVTFVVAVTVIEAGAETPSTPAGFYRLDCLGNSDTIVSIPFSRPETNFSHVQSIAGSTITVSETPGWLSNQFVYASGTQSNTYYLRFLTSTKEGVTIQSSRTVRTV